MKLIIFFHMLVFVYEIHNVQAQTYANTNVALHGNTSQSSTYEHYRSDKAIDDNTDSDLYKGHCTHTGNGDRSPWFQVTFPQSKITNIVIHNRNLNQDRLKGFKLQVYNGDQLVHTYIDTDNTDRNLYTIDYPYGVIATTAYITQSNTAFGNSNPYITICEIKVFGFVNVALHRSTSQSSQLLNYGSDRAVDGDTDGDLKNGHCTHTGGSDQTPWFNITFPQSKVNDIKIYNRDSNKDRLKGFKLELYDGGVIQNTYNDTETSPQDIYTINFTSAVTASNVVIRQLNNAQGEAFPIITICEIQIFGDIQECQKGYYGAHCFDQCSSHCGTIECKRDTGSCYCKPGYNGTKCDTECLPGTYGDKCERNCSTNCITTPTICNKETGFCLCKPGYNGSFCEQECPKGTYGDNCTHQCSKGCSSRCNITNGNCTCEHGFAGDACDRCYPGRWGPSCLNNCSENCLNVSCDGETGSCMYGCKEGFTLSNCTDSCDRFHFGRNCSFQCSSNCTNGTCNSRDGSCDQCVPGYQGNYCGQALTASQDPPVGVIVGVIIGVIVIILVIVSGILIWRRRQHQLKLEELDMETRTGLKGLPKRLSQRSFGTKETSENVDEYKTETVYYKTSSELGLNMAIKVNELNTYMKTHDQQFFVEQFKEIPQAQNVTTEAALIDENKNKNRYKNVCPYDHSRVNLLINKERKEGDYINASYIQDNNNKVKFIASQGPNTEMINDFIRMLWEQKTEIVVMLTNLIEEGKVKCERYWPESGKIMFGDISVNSLKTQTFADYTIRRMELSKHDEEPHLVSHFHFTSWPDQSTPSTPWALVDFAQKVFVQTTTSPIVVHCSAGVGRTGTFIALHNILQQAEETGQVDFYNTLVKLRKDRIFMIQTGDQYAFLHRAAQVAILCNKTNIELKDISGRVKDLIQNEVSKQTLLENEFQSMIDVSDSIRVCQNDETIQVNREPVYQNSSQLKRDVKNRFPAIVPRNCDRPYLTIYDKEMNDYINAAFVQGFQKKNHHILTQLPMPATVTDLWRLVTQYNISIIVAFETKNISKDQTMAMYLPTAIKGVTLSGDYFKVKCMDIQNDELWEEQTLKVRSDKSKSNSQDVFHLKCKFTILESKYLLRLLKKIKSYNLQSDGKIVYMCRDGATYSGLCCVLYNLLDRLDGDSSISVPLVVGAVKTVRPEVIPNMVQYRTVYDVLEKYSDISTPYDNMDENDFPRA